MLIEKEKSYGVTGGFFETNNLGNYTHALGEARLKLFEFAKDGRLRDLIKAVTWLYLIYEAEIESGPKQD